ncbi:hypothetical protein RND81_02G163200 [Saponaria officinalis]|uniref:WRKY domain-containing protein n=1 Tax=Saponaria officinalis TaxID=3572 RepID=A0AAW1MN64_SAPOF
MEVSEADRIVISKPVASRPTSSGFQTFSELLAGAIDASPSRDSVPSMSDVWAIRPKTVRPATNTISQVEASVTAPSSSSDKVAGIEKQSIKVCRPLAKVVSKATAFLLASMGNFNTVTQHAPTETEIRDKGRLIISQPSSSLPQVEQSQPVELPRMPRKMLEEHKMTALSSVNVDRISSDGYNWRKYGQKQVKGSEYPRSYYKCTHSNCAVRKKVERSLDGEVAEIVYKGEHNHPKPHFLKRSTSGVQGQDYDSSKPESTENVPGRSDRHDMRFSEQLSSAEKAAMLLNNPEVSAELIVDPKSKRRKHVKQKNEAETCEKGTEETRIWVRNNSEPEIMGDGFRWRKYGQKVVKGNPYPRSYYKCTSPKCNVRKHVERAMDDTSAFITTYEGKHNHERPLSMSNLLASKSDS